MPKHTTLAARAEGAGLADRRVRRRVRPRREVGPEPGIRHLLRQVRRLEVQVDLARRRGAPRRRGRRQRDALARAARRRGRFFAWLHFYDAHSPYDPPEPFKSRFRDRPYAGEIAYVDYQVGRVLQWLDTRGLADRTIVVAIGDHGESLNEHGEGTHGLFIYDATTRVPFIVRAPFTATRGRRVPGVVRTEDVMPTVLDLVGRPSPGRHAGPQSRPAADRRGADSEPRCLQRVAVRAEPLRVERAAVDPLGPVQVHRGDAARAVRPRARSRGAARTSIDERRSARRSDGARSSSGSARRASSSAGGPSAVDPETRERLAALGYIGSFAHTAAEGRGGAARSQGQDRHLQPDDVGARDRTGRMTATRAIARLKTGRRAGSRTSSTRGSCSATSTSGSATSRSALEQYKRALADQARLRPRDDQPGERLPGARQLRRGDPSATSATCRRIPKNAWVRYQLGELYVDLERARQGGVGVPAGADRRHARRVGAQRARRRRVQARRSRRRPKEEIRAALAQKPDVKLAHFNLALIAEQRRDFQTAIAEYQKEIDTQADAFKAAFNLGKLYEQLGDAGRAGSGVPQVDRDQPALRRRVLLPRQALPRSGPPLRRGDRAGAAGLEVGPQVRVRAARPLRARRHLQPIGPRRRGGARSGARPRARGAERGGVRRCCQASGEVSPSAHGTSGARRRRAARANKLIR